MRFWRENAKFYYLVTILQKCDLLIDFHTVWNIDKRSRSTRPSILTLISRKLNDDCCRQDLERKAHWRSRQKCFYPGELKVSKSVAMAAIIKQEWRKLSFFGASRIQQGFLKRIQPYLPNHPKPIFFFTFISCLAVCLLFDCYLSKFVSCLFILVSYLHVCYCHLFVYYCLLFVYNWQLLVIYQLFVHNFQLFVYTC